MAEETIARTRVCTKCGASKPATTQFFYKKLDGVQAVCISCRREERRKIHAELSPEARNAISKKLREYRARQKVADPDIVKAKERGRYMLRRERQIAAQKEKRAKNPEKYREIDRKSYTKHLASRLKTEAEWRARNRERDRKNRRDYFAALRADPQFRVRSSVSAYMNFCLKSRKSGRTWSSIVDYTLQDLVSHLERQFKAGMNWGNYGRSGWHIDHIVPVSSFKFTSPEDPEFKACWSLSNLRPLWAVDNLRKGNKRLTLL